MVKLKLGNSIAAPKKCFWHKLGRRSHKLCWKWKFGLAMRMQICPLTSQANPALLQGCHKFSIPSPGPSESD
jgi:hypothetical protein